MAAFVLGAGSSRILLKHLLINTMGQIIVTVTLMVPQAIFTEAWLSFLGVGISAPMASWGTLAQDARELIMTYPMQTVYPMIANSYKSPLIFFSLDQVLFLILHLQS